MIINHAQCESTVSILNQDPAFIQGVKAALLDSGLASLLGLTVMESSLDPYRPCPGDWTAFQIAFFDNGEPQQKRNRPKIQRTRMRHGGNLMVWTRDAIDFASKAQVAWQANFHLWSAEQARQIARDLQDEGYIDESSVAMIDDATAYHDDALRFSIPLLKIGGGTRWMKRHLIISRIEDDAPNMALIHFPETEFSTTALKTSLPNGTQLTGKAISQARIARDVELEYWATEIL